MSYKRILLPLICINDVENLLEKISSIPEASGAELILLRLRNSANTQENYTEMRGLQRRLQNRIVRLCAEEADAPITDTVVRYAQKYKADLMFMPNKGNKNYMTLSVLPIH